VTAVGAPGQPPQRAIPRIRLSSITRCENITARTSRPLPITALLRNIIASRPGRQSACMQHGETRACPAGVWADRGSPVPGCASPEPPGGSLSPVAAPGPPRTGILLANSQCRGNGSAVGRREGGDGRATGRCARYVAEPVGHAPHSEGGRRREVGQVPRGHAALAGRAQSERAHPLRERACDPGARRIHRFALRRLLPVPQHAGRVVRGLGRQGQTTGSGLGPGAVRARRAGPAIRCGTADMHERAVAGGVHRFIPANAGGSTRTGHHVRRPINPDGAHIAPRVRLRLPRPLLIERSHQRNLMAVATGDPLAGAPVPHHPGGWQATGPPPPAGPGWSGVAPHRLRARWSSSPACRDAVGPERTGPSAAPCSRSRSGRPWCGSALPLQTATQALRRRLACPAAPAAGAVPRSPWIAGSLCAGGTRLWLTGAAPPVPPG
jgi:hypothetical protein